MQKLDTPWETNGDMYEWYKIALFGLICLLSSGFMFGFELTAPRTVQKTSNSHSFD